MATRLMFVALCIPLAVYTFNDSGLADPGRTLFSAIFVLLAVAMAIPSTDEKEKQVSDDD